MKKLFFKFIMFSILLSASGVYAEIDKKGTADYPLFERYPGFVIRDQAITEYDEADLIVSPLIENEKGDYELDLKRVEGKIHNTNYRLNNQEASVLQLFRNYEKALKSLNAEFIFTCRSEACFEIDQKGSGVFLSNYLYENGKVLKGLSKKDMPGELGIIAAEVKFDDKNLYVMYILSADDVNEKRYINQSIIELDELDDEKIGIRSVDDLEKAINVSGKVVLDGIFFDHDKATIKAESKIVLDIITSFLKNNTNKNFYVVGHTDDSGSYDYNQKLSEERADAVKKALAAEGIKANRLSAYGVGPLSPNATNRNDGGKTANRRVELVEKIK